MKRNDGIKNICYAYKILKVRIYKGWKRIVDVYRRTKHESVEDYINLQTSQYDKVG